MTISEELLIRERGRQIMSISSFNAYFEIVSTPPRMTILGIYALNDIGNILGDGIVFHSSELHPGLLFRVRFFNVSTEQVASWQIQCKSSLNTMYTIHAEVLTQQTIDYESLPIAYVEAPPSVVEITRAMPKLKNGWQGLVVASIRGQYFHHPDCRKAKALHPDYLREYDHPQKAWDKGLFPCFDCL